MIKCCKHKYYQYNRKIPVKYICAAITHMFVASPNKRIYIAEICLGRKDLWCLLLPWVVTISQFASRSFCSTQKDDPAKQTNLRYLKLLTKPTWVSIYTELKGPNRHSAGNATKPEATPWSAACRPLPSWSLQGAHRARVLQSTAWRWPGPGREGTAESSCCCHYLQSFRILDMPLHAHLFLLR